VEILAKTELTAQTGETAQLARPDAKECAASRDAPAIKDHMAKKAP
jgi:hypothetical protein